MLATITRADSDKSVEVKCKLSEILTLMYENSKRSSLTRESGNNDLRATGKDVLQDKEEIQLMAVSPQ